MSKQCLCCGGSRVDPRNENRCAFCGDVVKEVAECLKWFDMILDTFQNRAQFVFRVVEKTEE